MKSFLYHVARRNYLGLKLFFHLNGLQLAAASTFYALLAALPFLMLLVSALGFVGANYHWAQNTVIQLVKEQVPTLSPILLAQIQSLINGRMKILAEGVGPYWPVLIFSSLALFQSFIIGINTISKRKEHFFKIHLKTLLAVPFTIICLFIFVTITPFGLFLLTLLKNQEFLFGLAKIFPQSALIIGRASDLAKRLIQANILQFIFQIFILAWIYRLLLPKKKKMNAAVIAAISFTLLFSAGKTFFWSYLLFSKDLLAKNYGDFYTLIVAILWPYFVMIIFFLGASIYQVEVRQKND